MWLRKSRSSRLQRFKSAAAIPSPALQVYGTAGFCILEQGLTKDGGETVYPVWRVDVDWKTE
jgi:hypothetical protein